MSIFLLLICFVLVLLNTGAFFGASTSKKEVLICSVLIFSALVIFITEILSLLHALGFVGILLCWLIVAMLNLVCLYVKRRECSLFCSALKQQVKGALTGLPLLEKIIPGAAIAILILVFVQGVIFPPSNWDSMTYHLARIPNWISHRSVAHYPTSIVRQNYQPPFAEYVLMHFNILNRADYFSASVQFLFLLFSLAGILYIVKGFGLGRRYQVIAIALTLSIPEVMLQASSTQNDVVVSFFIISACIFAFKAIKEPGFKNYLFLGLSIGIGILTKGTAYVYQAPVILVFGIAVLLKSFRLKSFRYISYSLLAVLLVICINSGFYYRNYSLYHNILGVDKTESQMYANQKMSSALFISGIIKNGGLHFGIIYDRYIPATANKVIYKLHAMAGIDINDPAVNYRNMKFTVAGPVTNEDYAPNLLHFLLIVVAVVMLIIYGLKKQVDGRAMLLFLTVLMQVTVFCLYLKWQPWNTRLHVPLFLLFIPLIIYLSTISKWYSRAVYALMPVALIFTTFTILHNSTRPLGKAVFNGRYQNYFIVKPPATYTEYNGIVQAIQKLNYKNIGLLIGSDDWEYPLFADSYSRELNPIHINVDNITASSKVQLNSVDCIVSTLGNKKYIDYKGRRYYNQSSRNKVIYLYISLQ